MNKNSDIIAERSFRESCAHRLVLIAIFSSLATLLIASFYPSGKAADELMSLSFRETYFWIAAQSFALSLPGLLIGIAIGVYAPRLGALLGAVLVLSVPVIVLCDAMTFNWIAERFLSSTMSNIVTSLLPALSLHVTPASVVQASILAMVVLFSGVVVWKISGLIAAKWESQDRAVHPLATTTVLSVAALLSSYSALRTFTRTTSEMARSSTRHPFCAFHLVGFRGVGVPVPSRQAAVLPRLRGLQAIDFVHEREAAQLALSIDVEAYQNPSNHREHPNVILVVVECLRPEVIDPAVMPNLHAFAQQGIRCTNNFASGNATCQSMFSLVTGLEAVWYRRRIASEPILNRLLHQAGYRLAFYGGQTDWKDYHMDGYISPLHYDHFQVEEPDLPGSDLRAIERTIQFIDAQSEVEPSSEAGSADDLSSPRAAICYVYASHSRFRYSDPEDQVFQPVASDSVLMSRSPELRDQVFNRYKNSLRTVDRMLAPLLREDCVVMVMGDHGEPFLDDGTAIHGTRLSRFQNMTPAVIYYPGVQPRELQERSFHADLLPTLLAILGIPLTDPSVMDGLDLIGSSQEQLATRTFASCNFLDPTLMLIGPWSADPNLPFGHRVSFSIWDWQSSYLNPIDDEGYEWEADDRGAAASAGSEAFREWALRKFGEQAIDESLSSEQLFTRFFRSEDDEARRSALEIASSVADPEPYLYDLIAEATGDRVAEIRNQAKDLVIRINRYRGRREPATP